MLAVIQTGGKQYKVSEKQTIQVEKLEGQKGDTLHFDQVLLIANDAGEVKIGSPFVTGAKVEAKIVETGKGKKVDVIKFKSKVRYRRKIGHRQPFTKIMIEKITA